MIISLLEINTLYERSAYFLEHCTFEIKETFIFANETGCKVELSKLLQKEFVKSSNFDLYKYCMNSLTFKTLLLETTSLVCVFIGLMFPVCVSTAEDLFELFHAV